MTTQEQTRADLLAALAELGRLRPQWRLGQTVANLATTAGRLDGGGVWDLEDEEAPALPASCSASLANSEAVRS